MGKLKVDGLPVRYVGDQIENSYFCLTDMCKNMEAEPSYFIRSWLRNRGTVEFIGIWEERNNEDFNHIEFDMIKMNSGVNSYVVSIEKLQKASCKSVFGKAGRYGGTYGHIAIAFHFANWLSAEFYLSFITAFLENNAFAVKRLWSKLNYRLHTEGVKNSLPTRMDKISKVLTYASEADILNIAVFGQTASQWREQHPSRSGNMRDHARPAQLHVMANLEMLNSFLLEKGYSKEERSEILVSQADYQFNLLHSLDKYKR